MQRDLEENRPSPQASTPEKTPEQIEAEIYETREAIDEDIRALGDRLSPDRLKQGARQALRDAKEEAKDMLRDAKDHAVESVSEAASELGDRARRAGRATSEFVTSNGVPLALIGLGAGLLALTARRQRRMRQFAGEDRYGYMLESDYPTRRPRGGYARQPAWEQGLSMGEEGSPRERVREGVERVREGAEEMSERVDMAKDRVRETASEWRGRAQELRSNALDQMGQARVRTREFAEDNPMAVAALALALGLGVGLLFPTTSPENRLMGGARQRVFDEMRRTAQRVGRVAKETAGEMKGSIAETGAPH